MVCDSGLTETRTSRNSFTLYSTRLAKGQRIQPAPPILNLFGNNHIKFSLRISPRSRFGIGGAAVRGVAFNPTPSLDSLNVASDGVHLCRHSTALVVLESGGGGNAACGIMGRCTHWSGVRRTTVHLSPSPPGNPPFRSLKVVVIVHSHLLFMCSTSDP